MADESDPDKLMGPGGMSMRELHELVKKSAARDFTAREASSQPEQAAGFWQHLARLVWNRKKT